MCPYDTSAVWEQVKKHFEIQTRYDLLDHCYAKFDKAFFASLCEKLSYLATEGDPLSLHLFEEAGRYLAKATTALLPHVSDELLHDGNLNIVCVGSVWKSWNLLKHGYSKEVTKSTHKFGLNLISLTQAMAIGAAYLAADSIKFDLPRNYSHNYDTFQHFLPNDGTKTNGTHTNGAESKRHNEELTNGKNHTNGNAKLNGTKSNGTSNGIQTKKNGLKTKANASPNTIRIQDG